MMWTILVFTEDNKMINKRAGLYDFLKELGINAYNMQFDTSYTKSDYDILLLPSDDITILTYKLTNYKNPANILVIYLTLDESNRLDSFRLGLDANVVALGTLGDEIYVAYGTIDRLLIESFEYNLKVFKAEGGITGVILTEDYEFLVTEEDESYFTLEETSV